MKVDRMLQVIVNIRPQGESAAIVEVTAGNKLFLHGNPILLKQATQQATRDLVSHAVSEAIKEWFDNNKEPWE